MTCNISKGIFLTVMIISGVLYVADNRKILLYLYDIE